jgi:hypothetical protein
MLVPIGIYFIPYFSIQALHQRMCAIDAGLKVLRPIKPGDSLRLYNFKPSLNAAQSFAQYAPKLKYLELNPSSYEEAPKGSRENQIMPGVIYTFRINEKFGQLDKNGRKDNHRLIAEPVGMGATLTSDAYEYIERDEEISHGTKQLIEIMRNGVVYIRHTTYRHAWTGIRYPDGVAIWQCPDRPINNIFRLIF